MYFNFSIYNYTKKANYWYKLKSYHKQLSKNKHIEVETFFTNYYLLSFEFDCNLKGKDHAGIRLKINIGSLELTISFYDSRHWDYNKKCWENK